ncbi:ATP-binding protein [Desulfacinum infernum]|nr:ATP-binding protein [Desulfacinum infernum]
MDFECPTVSLPPFYSRIQDIVAMANSGGGLIIFGVDKNGGRTGIDGTLADSFDPANITNKLNRYASQARITIAYVELNFYRKRFGFLLIHAAPKIIVFESDGGYQDDNGRQKKAFFRGVIYTRTPGGNTEARQSDLDEMIDKIVQERIHSFVAKIEKVAHLPVNAELIARDPAAPSRGYVLVDSGKGIPVTVTGPETRDAMPLRDILDPSVPFSSYKAEVAAQTRQWRQGDTHHRVQKATLIRWYLNRESFSLSEDEAEFCFVSAGYCHGYVMFWASRISLERLKTRIEEEIGLAKYPMRDILPYVIGAFFWDEREEMIRSQLASFSGQSRNIARRIMDMSERDEFLHNARFRADTFTFGQQRYSFSKVVMDMGRSQRLFEELLQRDMAGRCPSNLRMVAHQLDIVLHTVSMEETR